MGDDGDLAVAERVGRAAAKVVREYIAEMRRQGRIKGKLFVEVRNVKRSIQVPYRED